ncbi:MAG: hypothetical protein F2693_00010 [Actinobacteria bacterium]|nr:hypothetical protein [Actinomycetota bacterium]
MIVLPAMPPEQTASWLGLLDLYERLADGWTLIGGQLVHLHCAERGAFPVRPTNDADTVIDVRADPTMLATFTRTLTDLGFASAGISADGLQHRWVRGDGSIDVLLPDGIGERASLRPGVSGSPTLPTAGGTQALQRSETVAVTVAGREGSVRRPNLVGALVGARRPLSTTRETPGSAATGATSSSSRGCSPRVTSGMRRSRRRTASGCVPWSPLSRRTARCCLRSRTPRSLSRA